MKIPSAFFMVCILHILIGGHSQLKAEPVLPQEPIGEETSLEVLFNRVLVYQKEGGTRGGLLVGMQNNDLILQIGTEDVKFPFKSLAKVVIMVEKKSGQYALSGMFIGMYLGNYLLWRHEGQPGAYVEEDITAAGIALWNLLCAAAGSGAGLLAGSMIAKDEEVFDLSGDQRKRLKEWERLKKFVLGLDSAYKKVHFSVQGGKVYIGIRDLYRDQFGGPQIGPDASQYEIWNFSTFNLLRSLRAAYSLKPWLDVGASVVWLGEPPWGKRISQYGNLASDWQDISIKSNVTGYYLTGAIKPFAASIPRSISWELGAGLGAAHIDFELDTGWGGYDHTGYGAQWRDYSERFKHTISETVFSGTVFTTLNLFLHQGLSLGVYADYAYLPDRESPGLPEVGLEARKLRFNNASIGFSLGLHF